MVKKIDVTDKVDFFNSDDECLPITKCICGQEFEGWTFNISIYDDTPTPCPNCGALLYFRNSVRVYQVIKEEE